MPKTEGYSVREATEDDVFDVVLLTREAYETVPEKDYVKFSSKKVIQLVSHAVPHDSFIVLVLENDGEIVGYFFGVIMECYFALESQATCLSWFIRPPHRSVRNAFSLLKQYEKWAIDQKVVSVNMIDIKENSSKVFEKLGYEKTEITFTKRIK